MSERSPQEHKETLKVTGQKDDSLGKWNVGFKTISGGWHPRSRKEISPGCLDRRVSGRILPEEPIQDGGRPSASVELETYDGKAPTWNEWICSVA